VTLDPYRDKRLSGRLARIAPYVSELEEQNRTVEVEVELAPAPPGLDLKPGTSADVELIIRERDDVLRVPANALLEGGRVLVVGADGRAHATTLRLGLRNWEWAEAQDGVSQGDRVIVTLDSDKLEDGAPVTVVGAGTATP
jgi:HlyD family secretion protein